MSHLVFLFFLNSYRDIKLNDVTHRHCIEMSSLLCTKRFHLLVSVSGILVCSLDLPAGRDLRWALLPR